MYISKQCIITKNKSKKCPILIVEEKLLAELEAAREERKEVERKREELVKKAKQLQHKTTNRRNAGMMI